MAQPEKIADVSAILDRYPNMSFVLLGDSNHRDPEVYAEILEPHDGVTFYNQISPRHFEAAACRTLQILYEGHYSGIFEAGRHYLSLRRDHSNLDEVLDRALDPHEHARLTETAFDDIVANDAYRYDAFVAELDDAMQVAFDAP